MRDFRQFLIILMLFLPCVFILAQDAPRASVRVQVDNIRPYVGQPITYTVIASVAEDIALTDFVPPAFDGLGQSSTLPPPQVATETRDGVTYTVTTQDYILYPLRSGALPIEQFQLAIPETAFDPAETFSSNRIELTVQPLPENPPTGFTNAIGQFDIGASISPDTITIGESVTLRVTIEGSGNIERVLAPEIGFGDTWRVADDGSTFQQDTVLFGSKSFQWTLIPDEMGLLEIPSIEFAFFNPQTERYETRVTSPTRFTVEPDLNASPTPDATATPTEAPTDEANAIVTESTTAEVVAIPDGEITATPPSGSAIFDESIERRLGLKDVPAQYVTALPQQSFWFLWFIPPALMLMALILSRLVGGSSTSPSRNPIMRQTTTRLKKLRTADARGDAYSELVDIIMQYLSFKAGTPVTDANVETTIAQLPEETRERVRYCLSEAESGQYAPVSDNDLTLLISRTRQTLREVDRAWR